MRASQPGTSWILALLFLVALALRLWVVPDFGNFNVLYSESGAVAQELLAGNGFVFDFFGLRETNPLQSFLPPLYPLLLWLALSLDSSVGIGVVLVVQAILSSLSVLLLYGIGRKLTRSTLVGLLAAIALAFYPVYIITPGLPHSLTVDAFLVLLVVLLALVATEREATLWSAIGLGVAYGVLLLIRPMWIGFAPLLFVWLGLMRRDRQWVWAVKTAGVTLGVALFIVMPWLVRNAEIHRQFVWISTNGGFTFWGGNNPFTTGSGMEVDADKLAAYSGIPRAPDQPDIIPVMAPYQMPLDLGDGVFTLPETELDRALYRAGWAFIRENPTAWQGLVGQKLFSFLWFRPNVGATYGDMGGKVLYQFVYAIVAILSLIGLIMARHNWRPFSLLVLIFVYYTVFYTLFHVQTRYRWEIEPLLLVLCALPVAWMVARFDEYIAIWRDAPPMAAS